MNTENRKKRTRKDVLQDVMLMLAAGCIVITAGVCAFYQGRKTLETYQEAQLAFASQDYETAAQLFDTLDGYKDSQSMASTARYAGMAVRFISLCEQGAILTSDIAGFETDMLEARKLSIQEMRSILPGTWTVYTSMPEAYVFQTDGTYKRSALPGKVCYWQLRGGNMYLGFSLRQLLAGTSPCSIRSLSDNVYALYVHDSAGEGLAGLMVKEYAQV